MSQNFKMHFSNFRRERSEMCFVHTVWLILNNFNYWTSYRKVLIVLHMYSGCTTQLSNFFINFFPSLGLLLVYDRGEPNDCGLISCIDIMLLTVTTAWKVSKFSHRCCWGFRSSEMWCCVVGWVVPEVSKERAVFETPRTTQTQANITSH
jgi:hypothetical protein